MPFGQITITGSFSSRPSTALIGTIFVPTDGGYQQIWNGSAWLNLVGTRQAVRPPLVSSLTWINQGTATATDSNNGITFADSGTTTSNSRHILAKSATTSSPYTFTVGALISNHRGTSAPIPSFGIAIRDSGSSKFVINQVYWDPATGGTPAQAFHITSEKWTNETTGLANYNNYLLESSAFGKPFWLRYVDDGTNLTPYFSFDGAIWHRTDPTNRTRTDFVPSGGNQVCAVIQEITNNSSSVTAEIFEWNFTNP